MTARLEADRSGGNPTAAPRPPGFVDLHSHSTASDGALAPAEVVETAARAGLAALALTDHDTLAGVAAAQEAGARLGVRIVAGVELSLMDGDKEVHMLGLHIARVDALQAELEAVRDSRKSRAEQIVAKLNTLGVPVTVDAVLAQAAGGAVGRPHIARALIAGGWVRDQREAFDKYLGAGRPANVEKQRITIADGIRIEWKSGDFVTLPPFCWHEHHNDSSSPAYMFSVTDAPVIDALGFGREDAYEANGGHQAVVATYAERYGEGVPVHA